jgi:acyl carrier protein
MPKPVLVETVNAKVRDVICDQLGIDEEEVTLNAQLVDDLAADSLDVIELVMIFEETYDIEIPDEDIDSIKTVGDIQRYLVARGVKL